MYLYYRKIQKRETGDGELTEKNKLQWIGIPDDHRWLKVFFRNQITPENLKMAAPAQAAQGKETMWNPIYRRPKRQSQNSTL